MTSPRVEKSRIAVVASALVASIREMFSLRPDTDYDGTLKQVRSDVELGSGGIWALISAIVVASVGLNVNSTAVIIGAMLISPLMGPIVGAGFGLATNDFALLRRAGRSLVVAITVGLVVSALYFAVSPLQGPQSELLARTRPTLYDVLIALFGGAAAVVAVTRKTNKSQVVPGVAIATALMPPLCTAGFGIASGDVWFTLGALHLFLINALFIFLATLGLARLMHFPRVSRLDPSRQTRARQIIGLVTLVVAVPSVYTGWTVVHEARFQQVARRFVAENLNFSDRALVNVGLKYSSKGSTISATLLGPPLPEDQVRALDQRLASFGLERTRLVLHQPVETALGPEQLAQMIRQGILDDRYTRNDDALRARETQTRVLEDELVRLRASEFPVRGITNELATLFPTLASIAIGREVTVSDTTAPPAVVVLASWRRLPTAAGQNRLRQFLALRLGVESLRLVNVIGR